MTQWKQVEHTHTHDRISNEKLFKTNPWSCIVCVSYASSAFSNRKINEKQKRKKWTCKHLTRREREIKTDTNKQQVKKWNQFKANEATIENIHNNHIHISSSSMWRACVCVWNAKETLNPAKQTEHSDRREKEICLSLSPYFCLDDRRNYNATVTTTSAPDIQCVRQNCVSSSRAIWAQCPDLLSVLWSFWCVCVNSAKHQLNKTALCPVSPVCLHGVALREKRNQRRLRFEITKILACQCEK